MHYPSIPAGQNNLRVDTANSMTMYQIYKNICNWHSRQFKVTSFTDPSDQWQHTSVKPRRPCDMKIKDLRDRKTAEQKIMDKYKNKYSD